MHIHTNALRRHTKEENHPVAQIGLRKKRKKRTKSAATSWCAERAVSGVSAAVAPLLQLLHLCCCVLKSAAIFVGLMRACSQPLQVLIAAS